MTREELEAAFAGRTFDHDSYLFDVSYMDCEGVPVCLENWGRERIQGTTVVIPRAAMQGRGEEEVIAWARRFVPLEGPVSYVEGREFVYLDHSLRAAPEGWQSAHQADEKP